MTPQIRVRFFLPWGNPTTSDQFHRRNKRNFKVPRIQPAGVAINQLMGCPILGMAHARKGPSSPLPHAGITALFWTELPRRRCELHACRVIKSRWVSSLLNSHLVSLYQLPARKENNCLEKEPKENSAGYSRCLKLSAICQLATLISIFI